MKFIAGLRVWGNWEIGENVLKVFPRFRGSANRRVDFHLPLIASISGRREGARGERRVASGGRTIARVLRALMAAGTPRFPYISIQFAVHLFSTWIRAARAADPDDSPRSCSTFRQGGLEGRREWNPNRPVSEMAA